MSRVYVVNLNVRVSELLEDEFRTYRVFRHIWVMRKPPGYAFIDYDDHRDDYDAIRDLNGKHNWRVKLSHYYRGGGDCTDRDLGSRELSSGSGHHCS